jgi:DNA-binding transcriptional regulator YiaG
MTFDDDDFSPITPAEIRQGRKELGLSVEELEQLIGADPAAVEAWEAGTEDCPLPGALKFALEYFKAR